MFCLKRSGESADSGRVVLEDLKKKKLFHFICCTHLNSDLSVLLFVKKKEEIQQRVHKKQQTLL